MKEFFVLGCSSSVAALVHEDDINDIHIGYQILGRFKNFNEAVKFSISLNK